MTRDDTERPVAPDVPRAAVGAGVLVLLIALVQQLTQGSGAAVLVATPALALSVVPLAVACWRPRWWTGTAALVVSGVPPLVHVLRHPARRRDRSGDAVDDWRAVRER